jgi:integrase
MTELRKRMIECLQLRGLSQRTQDMYVRAVRQLAEHYHKSPDLITEEELRQYFLYLKNVKHYSRSAQHHRARAASSSSSNTPSSGTGPRCRFVRAPRQKKLPVILSPDEVRPILGCIRLPRYRVCLATIYSCGLRLQEGTHLQVPDIDSARRVIHVRHGKGGKDRYVPLPQRTLERLRQYWLTHRHPVWIFPAPGQGTPGAGPLSPENHLHHSVPRLIPGAARTGVGPTVHRRPGRDGRRAAHLDPRPALPSARSLHCGRRRAVG